MDNDFFDVELYLIDLKSRFDKLPINKYYLSYSGGKDSHFLRWFIRSYLKRYDIEIVGANTFLEHPEIRDRILTYSDVVVYPKLKPMEVKEKYGIPCFSKNQDQKIYYYQNGARGKSVLPFINRDSKSWYNLNKKASELTLSGKLHKVSEKCCAFFKKEPLKTYEKKTNRKAILGVRSGESLTRKKAYKSCFSKNGTFTPIYDLSDNLLKNIYDKYSIPIPSVYSYVTRTGCCGCPYAPKNQIELNLMLLKNDTQRKFIIKYFKESYDVLGVDYQNIQQKLF
ncbi:MAG: hypothetical protein ACRCZK_01825 [Oscillospiraceae bacterium]